MSIIVLVLGLLLFGSGTAFAETTQLFGRRGLGDTYSGVEAEMSAQDPAMTCCAQFDSAGPVALVMKDLAGQPFIEGGNSKVWRATNNRFELHPYWSYNTGGTTGGGWRYSITLTAATYYKYSVWNIGSQQFKVRFCRGSTFFDCYELGTQGMNRDYFSHTTVGGEGNCAGSNNDCPIGYIAASNNRFLQWSNNQWYSYCYTETYFDRNTAYSWSFSSCNGAAWTLHYR